MSSWENNFASSNTGFGPIAFGQMAHHLWYSTETVDQINDPLDDLVHVGGTPWEEYEWEDGMEAPLRPSLRPVSALPERDDATRPDPWLLVPEGEREARVEVRTRTVRVERQRQAGRDHRAYRESLARRAAG